MDISYFYKDEFENSDFSSNLNFEIDSFYVVPTEASKLILAHHLRPLYRIKNCKEDDKSYILRKLRAKSIKGFKNENIAFDYLSAKELNVKNGEEVRLYKAKFLDKFRFFFKHPKPDFRFAFKLFLWAFLLGFISLLLTLYGILNCN